MLRVPEFSNFTSFINDNRRAEGEHSRTLERLSTLKKVNRGSDDPFAYRRITEAKANISQANGFQDVIESSLQRFQVTEGAMRSIQESLDDARELALKSTAGIYSDLELETMADEVAQIRLNVINRLNERYEGKYLFSGTAVDTEPFQDPATGLYSGNAELVSVRVSTTDTVTVNFPGDTLAFGPGGQGSADDMLDLLADLETAMRADDTALISAEIPRIGPIVDRLNYDISQVGTRSIRMMAEQAHYDVFEENLRSTLATIEEADLAEEALNLEEVRTRIDAQLRSQGSINRQSLLDFLG